MATNKGNTGTGTTRRGFLGALGATAAAMALPAVTLGTEGIADDWRAAISAWRREYRSRLPAFRAVYRAELERWSSPDLRVKRTRSEAPRLLHAAFATTASFDLSREMSR
jgi:hypothetical protein